MGSKRAQADRRQRLLAADVTEEEMAPHQRWSASTSGRRRARDRRTIMAELLALRYGREGGRLTERGSIHSAAAKA